MQYTLMVSYTVSANANRNFCYSFRIFESCDKKYFTESLFQLLKLDEYEIKI